MLNIVCCVCVCMLPMHRAVTVALAVSVVSFCLLPAVVAWTGPFLYCLHVPCALGLLDMAFLEKNSPTRADAITNNKNWL